jgi:outer membrane protein OmpA-like peptidoglycan-associated protein
MITGAEGSLSLELRDESVFSVHGVKANYFNLRRKSISTIGRQSADQLELKVPMHALELNASYVLEDLQFVVNDTRLVEGTETMLENLARLLREHAGLRIEIGVHTDARGDDAYNLQLSQARAEEIYRRLVRIGIDMSRISPKGYGETQLLNHCGNGVKCGFRDHMANRRVTFRVVEWQP